MAERFYYARFFFNKEFEVVTSRQLYVMKCFKEEKMM